MLKKLGLCKITVLVVMFSCSSPLNIQFCTENYQDDLKHIYNSGDINSYHYDLLESYIIWCLLNNKEITHYTYGELLKLAVQYDDSLKLTGELLISPITLNGL
ncbi:hypothetical protein QA597_05010 [Marinilabiliaceae bacterium ANBcel2]|nr:hypothetical protein [Marinilabiliaceae bacterium ANBcel2]